jgi:hypothetical protein
MVVGNHVAGRNVDDLTVLVDPGQVFPRYPLTIRLTWPFSGRRTLLRVSARHFMMGRLAETTRVFTVTVVRVGWRRRILRVAAVRPVQRPVVIVGVVFRQRLAGDRTGRRGPSRTGRIGATAATGPAGPERVGDGGLAAGDITGLVLSGGEDPS